MFGWWQETDDWNAWCQPYTELLVRGSPSATCNRMFHKAIGQVVNRRCSKPPPVLANRPWMMRAFVGAHLSTRYCSAFLPALFCLHAIVSSLLSCALLSGHLKNFTSCEIYTGLLVVPINTPHLFKITSSKLYLDIRIFYRWWKFTLRECFPVELLLNNTVVLTSSTCRAI